MYVIIFAEADFNLPNSELIFAVGETIQCANITVIDDNIVEGDESFFVEIRHDDNIITTVSAVLITDNDSKRERTTIILYNSGYLVHYDSHSIYYRNCIFN